MKTTLADVITFGKQGNGAAFQAYGWQGPESEWTWTDGECSALSFAAPEAPFGYFLEMQMGPAVASPIRPSQPVIITANDRRAAVLNLEHAGIYSIYCFAPRSGENRITLTIEHPGALRLSHYQRNGDPRALALSFRRIRILPLVEPAPRLTLDRVAHVRIGGKVAPEMIAQTERATGVTVHDLLTDFEMLAGDCMFGFVQRMCGSDPLGLLRFAGATPSVAMKGLESAFDGIGQDVNPVPAADGSDEWMVNDAFGLSYHSGKSLSESPEEVAAAERKKVKFLRAKFLHELDEAEKLFIYADRRGQPWEDALSLFLALRRVSNARMLWIRPTPHRSAIGRVQETVPGLYVGELDYRGTPHVSDVPLGGWLSVLAGARQLLHERAPN